MIDRSVAIDELERWFEANDIDTDTEGMDENDRSDIARQRTLLVRAIEQQRLVIDEEGRAIFTPKSGVDITFHECTGAVFIAMDKKKKSSDFGKMFAAMGEITRTSPLTFSKMQNSDLKVCFALMTYFLG